METKKRGIPSCRSSAKLSRNFAPNHQAGISCLRTRSFFGRRKNVREVLHTGVFRTGGAAACKPHLAASAYDGIFFCSFLVFCRLIFISLTSCVTFPTSNPVRSRRNVADASAISSCRPTSASSFVRLLLVAMRCTWSSNFWTASKSSDKDLKQSSVAVFVAPDGAPARGGVGQHVHHPTRSPSWSRLNPSRVPGEPVLPTGAGGEVPHPRGPVEAAFREKGLPLSIAYIL